MNLVGMLREFCVNVTQNFVKPSQFCVGIMPFALANLLPRSNLTFNLAEVRAQQYGLTENRTPEFGPAGTRPPEFGRDFHAGAGGAPSLKGALASAMGYS